MKREEKLLTKKDLFKVFLRSNLLQGSWNFERMQGLGFCFSMIPVIKKLYNVEEQRVALKRHLEFFNTHPFMSGSIIGVAAAMEEEKSKGLPIEEGSINGIKVGLMGPFAGVGDPVFWGTIRPVLAALGASLALGGNILGPLLFFILFNIIRIATKWYGLVYGYEKGTAIIKDMGGNKLQKLTEGASILGLFVMGALVAKWTHINIALEISRFKNATGDEIVITLQGMLDQLLPGLVPLLLTFLCSRLLKKNINVLWIVFGLFALGIIGHSLGILT